MIKYKNHTMAGVGFRINQLGAAKLLVGMCACEGVCGEMDG
jgi:hypothetical protein